MSLFASEPAAAPVNVTGHKSSSSSIFVQWNKVPAADQNGVILTYTITYQSLTTKHNGSVTVNYPELQKNVTRLQDYTNYSIRVYASTEKGNGPASDPIVVITYQEGERSVCPNCELGSVSFANPGSLKRGHFLNSRSRCLYPKFSLNLFLCSSLH